jgi:hypothetical protein
MTYADFPKTLSYRIQFVLLPRRLYSQRLPLVALRYLRVCVP